METELFRLSMAGEPHFMSTGSNALEIYQAGPLTVIGFYGRPVLEGITVLDCRNELEEIAQKYTCTTMAFDLTNLRIVPFGYARAVRLHQEGGDRCSFVQYRA